MLDYDAVVIGGGPAGLTAGLHLSRAGHRALLLEREVFGGALKHVELLERDAGAISGARLASDLAEEAARCGLRLREAAVTGVEAFSSTRWVALEDGRGFSTAVVIVASGSRPRRLGIPGEDRLVGRGVIDCVPCDGGFFAGRRVAVCGSDDHALADALHLAGLAAGVTVLARSPELRAGPALRERALAHPRVVVRCGADVGEIVGSDRVEGVTFTNAATGARETLEVEGVVVRVGSRPNTEFLEDVLDLDASGRVVAGAEPAETSVPFVLAAGDVRAGSRPAVAAALADGEAAARRAMALLAGAPG